MSIFLITEGRLHFQPGIGIREAYRAAREEIHPIKSDRRFNEDINKIQNLIESGELLHRVEKTVGKLK